MIAPFHTPTSRPRPRPRNRLRPRPKPTPTPRPKPTPKPTPTPSPATHLKASDGVVGIDFLREQFDVEFPVETALLFRRPVEVALGLAALDEVGDHDDARRPHLPDHSPEVVDRVLVRPLSRDVFALLLVTVDVGTVDVVARVLLLYVQQHSAGEWESLESFNIFDIAI